MESSSLPDDPRRWPSDPWTLFGLPRDADLRAARREYVKLIRRFKPDHFPVQFKILRTAFETLQTYLERRSSSPIGQEAHPANLGFKPYQSERAAGRSRRQSAEKSSAPAVLTLDEEIDAIWQTACQGRGEEAYAKGVALWNTGRHNANLALRLYWLLLAAPEYHENRACNDWLYEAALRSQEGGPAIRIYCALLRRDRAEALGGRCQELLQKASPTIVVQLALQRWRGAARAKHWNIIIGDLDCLRPRLAYNEPIWSHLLLTAIDELLWAPGDLVQPLLREFHEYVRVGSAHYDESPLLDHKLEITRAWRALDVFFLGPQWLDESFATFTAETEELEPAISLLAAHIASLPAAEALQQFDQINHASVPVSDHLGWLLERLAQAATAHIRDRRPAAEIESVCAGFLRRLGRDAPYPRAELLAFCVDFEIDPQRVVEFAARCRMEIGMPPTDWEDRLKGDGPLRHIYHAHQACSH